MPYELWWMFGILAWFVAIVGARLIRQHIRAKERVAIREMLHKERLSALERQVPLPEIPLEEIALEESAPIVSPRALAIALIGVGSGALPAFYLAPIAELHDIWPIGLIPLTLGLACAFGTWKTRS